MASSKGSVLISTEWNFRNEAKYCVDWIWLKFDRLLNEHTQVESWKTKNKQVKTGVGSDAELI